MRKLSSSVFGICLLLLAPALSAGAHPQNPQYVYDGKILKVADEDFSQAKYSQWQVWLYEEDVRVPHYTVGMQYSRWGLIEGNSAENAVEQLRASQNFEAAFLKFFGPGAWGRYTFFNPVGPIAVTDRALEDRPALEKLYQFRWLHERVNKLIRAATPSLENNQRQDPSFPVEGYFDQIRDALQRVSKLHSQLSRNRPQIRFIEIGIVQAKTQVAQAENDLPKITAVLPSVKLPTSKTWMSYAERAGSDGTIQVDVAETESGVLVQQAWTGGDGTMTGTVIITMIGYADIGKIDFEPPGGRAMGADPRTGHSMCLQQRSARRNGPESLTGSSSRSSVPACYPGLARRNTPMSAWKPSVALAAHTDENSRVSTPKT